MQLNRYHQLESPIEGPVPGRIEAGPIRSALQEWIKAQPAISFHDGVVDAVFAGAGRCVSNHAIDKNIWSITHERGGPKPLTTVCRIHSIKAILNGRRSLKQELSSLKLDSVPFPNGENPLQRDPEEGWKCWWCGCFLHVSKNCGWHIFKSSSRLPIN